VWLDGSCLGHLRKASTHLFSSFRYGLSWAPSTPFVARSAGEACDVASAAGVALPVDKVGCASPLARFFFVDLEATLGVDAAAGAVTGAMVSESGREYSFEAKLKVGFEVWERCSCDEQSSKRLLGGQRV